MNEKAMSEVWRGEIGTTEPSGRELRMRCLEAAARLMQNQGFDAGNREYLTLQAAEHFYEWVREEGQ